MKENGHWYETDGTPRHFVPRKDGSGNKPTTLKDARERNLIPSVTQIIRALDKPALREWLIKQAVMAVVTAPDIPGEAIDAKITRVLETDRQQDEEAAIAADLGSSIHAALEDYFLSQKVNGLQQWIEPAAKHVWDLGTVHAIERVLVGTGYAGKTDLILEADECWWIIDWKTTGKLPKSAYPEARLQLSAYAAAFLTPTPKPVRVMNVYISTKEPGAFVTSETENWREVFENGFKPLTKVWQFLNAYVPQQQ